MSGVEGLKPCPFCGGEAARHWGEHSFNDAMVKCENCHAEGAMFDVDDGLEDESGRNEAEAIAAWNRRAALSAIEGGGGASAAPIPTEPVADRWADLERLAKALQVSRDAFMMLSPEERMTGRPDWWVDYRAFSDAANPAAILELINAARQQPNREG